MKVIQKLLWAGLMVFALSPADDGVALASYNMDSHNCQRIVVNGMVKNEGDVEVHVPILFPFLTAR